MSARRLERLPTVACTLPALRIGRAATFRSRLLGLALMPAPDATEGLLLTRSSSVHSFGMRFALDLAWLDGEGNVVRLDRAIGARRIVRCRGARAVVELRAGAADALALHVGMRLVDQ
jgi:uncharacterized membrane protein (UPF0127 family)